MTGSTKLLTANYFNYLKHAALYLVTQSIYTTKQKFRNIALQQWIIMGKSLQNYLHDDLMQQEILVSQAPS